MVPLPKKKLSTIAAVATPAGTGGVCIVRVSGPRAHGIARRLCPRLPRQPRMRRAYFSLFESPADGSMLDEGLVLLFRAPFSFTGEDVAELHGHGGVAQSRALIRAALAAGAEAAGPGAFCRRAVENGRMDIARAEGIAELVAAETDAGLRAARSLMGGSLSRRVEEIAAAAEDLLSEWEAALDFPDETAGLDEKVWHGRLTRIAVSAKQLERTWGAGNRLRVGPRLVLAGPPNSGKSSLLNMLAGRERAIVDHAPGTTRDVLEVSVDVGGHSITLVDVAGVRDGGDRVEALGVEKAMEAVTSADVVVGVVDASRAPTTMDEKAMELLANTSSPLVMVANKKDLGDKGLARYRERLQASSWVRTSAKTGQGIDEMKKEIASTVEQRPTGEAEVLVTLERHREALCVAWDALKEAEIALLDGGGVELAAEGLREARGALWGIIGKGAVSDDILDKVFERFCIGK